MSTKSYTGPIENVVVVMLENRSYDNVLGGLYLSTNAAPYDQPPPGQAGLNGLADSTGALGDYSNPDPGSPGETIQVANQTTPTQDSQGTSFPPTTIPILNPGEFFSNMAQQILTTVPTPPPPIYSPWPPSGSPTLMQGFTTNYATFKDTNSVDVMNFFSPAQLPVTAWLANNYAVCDQWFGSLPTQTYPNRAFTLCAAPNVSTDGKYSWVDDPQYDRPFMDLPSICGQLDAVHPGSQSTPPLNWKVYFHDYCIAVDTVTYVKNQAESESNVNVATFDNSDWGDVVPKQLNQNLKADQLPPTFVDDVQNGTLPSLAFIEPRYSSSYAANSLPPNCNHPGATHYFQFTVEDTDPPIDVTTGEIFLMQVYNLLQASDYWTKTLLIVVYDEHGGSYDHVPPPAATPPGKTTGTPSIKIPPAKDLMDKTADGFEFNVLGCRVPALVISPYVTPGSSIPAAGVTRPFDHTSIIKTVWDAFNLSQSPSTISSLTDRDAKAPSLLDHLQPTVVNSTGQYESGPIIAGPSSLVFYHHLTATEPQVVLASAGSTIDLGAEVLPGTDWLTIVTAGVGPSGNMTSLQITVSVDTNRLHAKDSPYTGTIRISQTGESANYFDVPVTVYIQSLL